MSPSTIAFSLSLSLSFSLFGSLSSATPAHADRATPVASPAMRFAQPPPSSPSAMPPRAAFAPISGPVLDGDLPVASAVRFDRAAIRAKLAQNRTANLARFRVYQRKGVFPNNTFADSKLNVWLDANGNYCAAATIIRMSGNDALAQRTAEQNNFIKLADVTQGPLMDWILTSGLTQDEIAAIQEPFMPVVDDPSVEPQPVIAIDARMRRAEDRRLTARYKQVDAQIVQQQKKSLDLATDRLMAHPDLAIAFLNR